MITATGLAKVTQKPSNNVKPSFGYLQPNPKNTSNPSVKFWGIWLPVPTILAIINSLFWTWLILSTVGYTESPIEKASEQIIEKF